MSVMPIGPCPARVMIVTDFPTEYDVAKGVPLTGTAGDEFSKMLMEAGLLRSACFVTTAVRARPPANNIGNFIALRKLDITGQHVALHDKFVMPIIRDSLAILKQEIEMCQPNVIIALGDTALWMLTGNWGVASWRGSMLPPKLSLEMAHVPTVIPTFAPWLVLRQWTWRQIVVTDLRRAKKYSTVKGFSPPCYNFVIPGEFVMASSVLVQLLAQLEEGPKKLAIDIETRAGHISCIALAWSSRDAICIPLMCVAKKNGYWSLQEETSLVYMLYKILTHPNLIGVGQNFHYDDQYILKHWHFLVNIARDTMLSQHSCFSDLQKSLDFLSSMYCEFHCYWKDEGKGWDPSMDERTYWEYNCKDAVITYEVDEAEQTVIKDLGMQEVAAFQQSLYSPVLKTMNRGIRIDKQRRAEFALELQQGVMEREAWMHEVLGHPLNIKSPKQMVEFFYNDLKQKPVMSRKTKAPTCDDEALRKIGEREPLLLPILRKIAELRSLGVFHSTFIAARLDADDRMRCQFKITGTDTYRFASSKNAFGNGLNMQNIPSGGSDEALTLPNVRSLFIPDPGMTFFDIDLSSADLRIVTWEADVKDMKAMLRAGLDPYTEIAKEFYGDQSLTKKDPRRQIFKSFAHGTNYLGTAKGLAERLGLGVHEAERTQKWYFGRFPEIKKWQDDLKDQVTKRRMIQNVFGYRKYFFDRIEGTIFNQAAAWIPQSTVACLINRAYVEIDRTMPEVEILLQVHDSLGGQFPTNLTSWIPQRIVAAAEIPLPYAGDPLIIPAGINTSTKSWGDCK